MKNTVSRRSRHFHVCVLVLVVNQLKELKVELYELFIILRDPESSCNA